MKPSQEYLNLAQHLTDLTNKSHLIIESLQDIKIVPLVAYITYYQYNYKVLTRIYPQV